MDPGRFKRPKRVKAFTNFRLPVEQQDEPIVNPNPRLHQWNAPVPVAIQQQQQQEHDQEKEQEPEVPLRRSQRGRKRPRMDDTETEIFPDIATEMEDHPIAVYGPPGLLPPLNFAYINEMRYGGDRVVRLPTVHTPCTCVTPCGGPCACGDRCVPGCGSQCACLRLNGDTHPYRMVNGVRRLKFYRHMIFECNKCCCDMRCDLRLSHRANFQLELYHTGAKGFGVRSMQHIPRGACIGEYLGDLRMKEHFDRQSNYT